MSTTDWIALGSLIIALGSLAVAVGIYLMSRRAMGDEWAREWARQRPVVYPLALRAWAYREAGGPYEVIGSARVLPLKNGGRGPALNVTGEVSATSPDGTQYECQILGGTIAAGDLFDARIVPHPGIQHWGTATGVIRYSDLVGGLYEARFEFSLTDGNELALLVHEARHSTAVELQSRAGVKETPL